MPASRAPGSAAQFRTDTSFRQQRRKLSDQERIDTFGIVAIDAEGDARKVAAEIRQTAMAPGLAFEALRLGE